MKGPNVPRDVTGHAAVASPTAVVTASAASVYFPVYTLVAYPLVLYYHCRSAMICRDDLELRWRLLMYENEFSHISLLLYISTAF